MPEVDSPDELYGLDPGEFVAARDALARRLRAEGRREEAAEVKALRRPPKSAWALNVLARTDSDRITAVGTAASALAAALGGDGDVREAQVAYRDAIHEAVSAAAAATGVDGDTMRARMRDTLYAAGADADVFAALAAGTLRDDLEAPGFGGAVVPVGPRAARAPSASPAAKRAGRPDGDARATAPRTSATPEPRAPEPPAEREVDPRVEAERRARERRRRELERDVGRLESRVGRLQRIASDAEERAAAARADADAAAAELESTRRELAVLTEEG